MRSAELGNTIENRIRGSTLKLLDLPQPGSPIILSKVAPETNMN